MLSPIRSKTVQYINQNPEQENSRLAADSEVWLKRNVR